MSSNAQIISVKDLKKTFTQGKEKLLVLNNINLEVKEGEIISLVGESGCGKSTLLQIMGTLMNFDSGEVKICDKKISKESDRNLTRLRRNNIGFIYQQHHLLSDFTALENVAIACKIAGKSNNEAKKRAIELLAKLDLEDRINHKPSELSGGQQQRVAVARAFANNPQLILADEPTGNLDEKNSGIVSDMFIKISKEENTSLVIATHNKEISKKTNKIYEISGGQLSVL